MGVAVRGYIDILIIIITFPYSTCISPFFGSSVPTCSFFFNRSSPAKTMSRSIIVHTSLSLRVLHSLEYSQFMGGSLAEYLGISSDVHTFFAVMHLPLVSIGNAYSFLTSLYAEL